MSEKCLYWSGNESLVNRNQMFNLLHHKKWEAGGMVLPIVLLQHMVGLITFSNKMDGRDQPGDWELELFWDRNFYPCIEGGK